MNKYSMSLYGLVLALLFTAGTASATPVTYNYLITGDVYVGDETAANAYDLTVGETITAYGTFTADLSGSGDISVLFGTGSGNTMTIDLNGTLLTASDDDNYAGGLNPFLTFNSMSLTDFDYLKSSLPPYFNSSFLGFDDLDGLYGEWQANVSLTAVPVPAAAWLFGSGLLGLVSVARRRKA